MSRNLHEKSKGSQRAPVDLRGPNPHSQCPDSPLPNDDMSWISRQLLRLPTSTVFPSPSKKNFTYLFSVMLGFCWRAGLSPVGASRSCSPAAVRGLLAAVASLAVDHGLQGARASVAAHVGLAVSSFQALEHGLNSCGTRALLLQGMWDPPRLGIQCLLTGGGFFTTEPSGKPPSFCNN